MTLTITGLFDSHTDAKHAYNALVRAGIDRDDVNVISNAADSDPDLAAGGALHGAGNGAGIGAAIGGVAFLMAGLGILAIPGAGPVVAAGWLVSALTGAIAGSIVGGVVGGVVGAISSATVQPDNMESYESHIKRGGAVLCVRADEGAEAERVNRIISSHQVTATPTGPVTYTEEGWHDVDPTVRPTARERAAGRRH